MTCTPTGKLVVKIDATPEFTGAAFPNVVPLSNNCTVPVGVALPCGTISTLKVTGVPKPTFRAEEDSVVVVATWALLVPPPPHPNTAIAMPTTNPAARKKFLLVLPPPATTPVIPSSTITPARPKLHGRIRRSATLIAELAAVTVRLSCVVACPPETGTLAFANEQVYPAGVNVPPVAQVRATVPANPPTGAMTTAALPALPAVTGRGVGETSSVKLCAKAAGFAAENIKLKTAKAML